MNSPPASSNPLVWKVRGREIDLSRRGLVMGIVNVTPDSFSDGGQFLDPSKAIDHALALEAEGADILDIGGESTRPGAADVPEAEERARILPVIEQLASAKNPETLLSIDTLKPGVARDAVAAGADIINDVSGLRDPAMR